MPILLRVNVFGKHQLVQECKSLIFERLIKFVSENVDDNRHFVFYLLFLSLTNERMRKGQVNIL
jgi:hypothetical protein